MERVAFCSVRVGRTGCDGTMRDDAGRNVSGNKADCSGSFDDGRWLEVSRNIGS